MCEVVNFWIQTDPNANDPMTLVHRIIEDVEKFIHPMN